MHTHLGSSECISHSTLDLFTSVWLSARFFFSSSSSSHQHGAAPAFLPTCDGFKKKRKCPTFPPLWDLNHYEIGFRKVSLNLKKNKTNFYNNSHPPLYTYCFLLILTTIGWVSNVAMAIKWHHPKTEHHFFISDQNLLRTFCAGNEQHGSIMLVCGPDSSFI